MQLKSCYFCKNQVQSIDFKDVATLQRYLSIWSKIKGPKEARACSKHKKKLTKAIKRARFLALIPYSTR